MSSQQNAVARAARSMNAPHLWTFLSRGEFALAYCICFVTRKEEYADCYPIDRYPTPGHEDRRSDIPEQVKRAIRYLALEHGMRFERLVARRTGEIGVPVGQPTEPLCPAHNLYVSVLRNGGHLNVDTLLPQAIRHARQCVPSLPTEPLASALSEIEELLAQRRNAIQPEVLSAVSGMRREKRDEAYEALASLGIRPEGEETTH